MNKTKIVLASLLKPVTDTRMYEKFGISLAQTNKYEVNIIGFYVKNIPQHKNIICHPIFNFKRLSLQRLLAPLKYFKKLIQVKPELIIVHTHDLQLVTAAYKIIFGCKIIYDVQENYKQNIIWSSNLPKVIRFLLAYGVRLKEWLTNRMFIHSILAEKCYINECSFIMNDYSVIENKARKPVYSHTPQNTSKYIKLIYTGTIAESYGIFDAIKLTQHLHEQGINVHLLIIGYCPVEKSLKTIQKIIQNKAYIKLIGGNSLVDHQLILQYLTQADFALIPYQINPSNQNCFPTRIWECLAYRKPMIFKPNHPWNYLINQYNAGIILDYNNPPTSNEFLEKTHKLFYTSKLPHDIYWEEESKKLLTVIHRVLHKSLG